MDQPTIRMIGMLLIAAAERMEEADLSFGAVLDGADAELLSRSIATIDEKLTRNQEYLLSVADIESLANTSADSVVDILRSAVEQYGLQSLDETIVDAAVEAWNRRCESSRVPAGFKLVPIEPTRKMMQAGFDVKGSHLYELTYRAMIEAAPTSFL